MRRERLKTYDISLSTQFSLDSFFCSHNWFNEFISCTALLTCERCSAIFSTYLGLIVLKRIEELTALDVRADDDDDDEDEEEE